MWLAWLRLLRPQQYTKNVLVLVPFVFAKAWSEWSAALLNFIAWCLMASAIYAFNDTRDAEADRQHPTKRFRPIASGALSKGVGYATTLLFGLIALGLGYRLGIGPLAFLLGYLVNNLLYSWRLKRIQLLDVFSVATGFVLRIHGGASAVQVAVSPYLFMTVFFLSLYLALGKRRYERLLMEEQTNFRAVLERYSVYYLDQLMVISATMTLVVYTQYLLEGQFRWLIWTLPLVVLGIFRYYHITHNLSAGEPSRELFSDLFLLGLGAAYGVLVLLEVLIS